MEQSELNKILKEHRKWLAGEGGERANLREADLQRADLREANLQYADLQRANLQRADLRGADLLYANLQGADIDFSCWPLWCGTYKVKVDKRIAVQLAAHFCALDCDDKEYLMAKEAILPFAKQFHRIDEFPLE